MGEMTLAQAKEMAAPHRKDGGMLSTREAQEVQAAVFMAKSFPRDEERSIQRIQKSCQRIGLAQKAVYSYPKGGTKVTGPSIRLAEAIAQQWGNIQMGVMELEQRDGESTCMAYAWDIETNTRDSKIFTVPHKIQTKSGEKVLTDPRDIYELVANQGARRKRACILTVIPGDIVDLAIAECNKTLSGQNPVPLIDRLRELCNLLEKYFSVPISSIERYFGYPLANFSEMDWQSLGGIYNILREGGAKREDYFKMPAINAAQEAQDAAQSEEETKKAPAPKRTNTPKVVDVDAL